jgi:hypothetical protein
MVDRAFLLSSNKTAFFDQRALAEANRYTAAIFTAIVYDQRDAWNACCRTSSLAISVSTSSAFQTRRVA